MSPAPSLSSERRSRHHSAFRWIAVLAPILLVVLLFALFGRVGYNPSDDGNILAQTRRILHGQIPHKDITFARPMGSALLHVIDYAIPMPRFEASRLLGIGEFVLYSLVFTWLIYDLPPSRWRFFHVLGALAALLVNIHAFPLMGWYTTDGLVFVALGFLSLERGIRRSSSRHVVIGMALLGVAPLMKQSFALAPLLGAVRLATITEPRDRIRRTAQAIAASMTPTLLYVGTITALGGFPQMISQIGRAEAVWGKDLVDVLSDPDLRLKVALVAALVAAVCLALRAAQRSTNSSERARLSAIALILRAGVSGVLISIPLAAGLAYRGAWALLLFWALVAYLLVDGFIGRRLDVTGIGVASVAWMTALSWGYPLPNLVGGTVLLFVLHRMWSKEPPPSPPYYPQLGAAALVVSVILAVGFAHERYRHPYYDRPKAELTSRISAISREFGGIRTNRLTARYLQEIKYCVLRYPASHVAFLPDNPGIYPALGLMNPFPMDWMYPNEVRNESKRVLSVATSLDRSGAYLVMFQTFAAFDLPSLKRFVPAQRDSRIFFYNSALGDAIESRLHGRQVLCGPFRGVYRS
jgi:hypothetical protein